MKSILRNMLGGGSRNAVGTAGRQQASLIAKHFDRDFYLKTNPDVVAARMDPLRHYLEFGWVEGRRPNAWFDPVAYAICNPKLDAASANLFSHFLADAAAAGEAPRGYFHRKLLSMRSPAGGAGGDVIASHVAEAMALEPMVGFPRDGRHYTSPTTLSNIAVRAGAIRNTIGTTKYPYVVAVPHIRMSGAARNAGLLTVSLAKLVGPENVLVLVTDLNEVPNADWFPKEVRRFDLATLIDGVVQEHKSRLLIDLLRGMGCKTLFNVNSRLVWDTLVTYGIQMAHDFRIMSYLFTWDEDKQGRRGGYPIQWLRNTASCHRALLTDNQTLADDVMTRFGYLPGQVEALYCPPDPMPSIDKGPPRSGAPRFIWAGRLDRQKRFDIFTEIARMNGDLGFDVYGDMVLKDSAELLTDIPPNVTMLKPYKRVTEVIGKNYSALVYTSQWDGIPNVVTEFGAAEIPVIAPNVGGIAEVITPDTGWLIDDFTDVGAYSEALRAIAADPAEAARRARNLKHLIDTAFSESAFTSRLQQVLTRHGH